jgi:hypothetical protein
MTTALKIASRAFQKAGIKAAETPLEASEIEDALDVLNDLINAWNATGVLKGVSPVLDIGEDLKEPSYSSWALKANLAIMIAGEYGKEVSQSMAIDASQSMNALISASSNLSDIEYPDTLPIGSGNNEQYDNSYDRDFFPENELENF